VNFGVQRGHPASQATIDPLLVSVDGPVPATALIDSA
jgi:hypothetical protein